MQVLTKDNDKCPDQKDSDAFEKEGSVRKRSYYYDDAHGYEDFDPSDNEDDEEEA